MNPRQAFPGWLVDWASRHPRWALAALGAVAVAAALVLLFNSQNPIVLYQDF